MTDDVLWSADQVIAVETADVHEGIVAVADDAMGIGGGDEFLVRPQSHFALCNGLIVSHFQIAPFVLQNPSAQFRTILEKF
ncbi:hypothetical protein [Pseudomonas chlororaphis]